MKDKFLEYVMPVFLIPIFIIGLVIVNIISIFMYPLFRIPIGRKIIYELKLELKAVDLVDILRTPIEGYTKNVRVWFENSDGLKVRYLYVPLKEMNKLPKEVYDPLNEFKYKEQEKTIVAIFETRRLRFYAGYLPAKLLSYEIVEGKPTFCK